MTDEVLTIESVQATRSSSLAKLAEALAKAQSEIEGAAKDKKSHHGAYADLASVWDACRVPLTKHGLSVVQAPSAEGPRVTVTTLLLHSSGEWIESALTMTSAQNNPQALGSCITYARRYALAAMVGIAPAEDDGHAASQPATTKPQAVAKAPDGFDNWLADLEATAQEGSEALKAAWNKSQPYLRKHLTDTQGEKWEALKARAAKVKVSA